MSQPTTDFTDVIARFGQWRLYSAGPDRYFFYTGQPTQADYQDWTIVNYDPTNGTISYGDIFRTQRDSEKAIPVQ